MLETDLCNKFIDYCASFGANNVNEYEGWDTVVEYHGILFGVQAKLQFNTHVIAQCLHNNNVDFKIILLPNLSRLDPDLELIAHRLRLLVVTLDGLGSPIARQMNKSIFYYRQKIKKRLAFPSEFFDLPAGVKSPRTNSEYKIALCKLQLLAEKNGYLVPYDFRHLGVRIIPKYYFRYDSNQRKWYLKRKPSNDYPHIYKNLKGK
jgi:hypothetical protein